jgi:hypothetical protein
MNFLRKWVAEKRRPDDIGREHLGWFLFKSRFLQVNLVCQTHSDEDNDFRPSTLPHALWLLEGEYTLVRQEKFFSVEDQKWLTAEIAEYFDRPAFHVFAPEDLYHIELYPAKTYGETILDMPGWMTMKDVRFDTQSQVWFLTWGWSWKALLTLR